MLHKCNLAALLSIRTRILGLPSLLLRLSAVVPLRWPPFSRISGMLASSGCQALLTMLRRDDAASPWMAWEAGVALEAAEAARVPNTRMLIKAAHQTLLCCHGQDCQHSTECWGELVKWQQPWLRCCYS